MKKMFLFLVVTLMGIIANAQNPQDEIDYNYSGKWKGELTIETVQLPLVFDIGRYAEHECSVFIDSPSQGAYRIEGEGSIDDNKIEIKIPSINASFSGINLDNRKITGTFSQNGVELPLDLQLYENYCGGFEGPTSQLMPSWRELYEYLPIINKGGQPQKPLVGKLKLVMRHGRVLKPKQELREVRFTHDSITLAGTLALPKNREKPVTAVILISGSGTQDRDESILGLKPFKDISDELVRKGFAVLRYDDRGAGQSSPLKGNETTFDFARDAQAAFDYLMTVDEIDHSRIGYIGHSEGASIAFINAASDKRVAFVISLGGPGVKGSDLMVQQNISLLDMHGLQCTPEQKQELADIFESIAQINDTEKLRNTLREKMKKSTLQSYTDEQIEMQVNAMTSPWYMEWIRFDPAPYLKKITCPLLALNGEWDFQVDAYQNLEAIATNKEDATCLIVPYHNHMFQESRLKDESMDYGALGNISYSTLYAITTYIRHIKK